MAQTFNIRGFVASIDIQPDEYLLLLNEIVVNAIQSIEEVLIDASENLKAQYSEWIVNAEKEKNERIRNYILNPDKPRLAYKHLLTVSETFEDISANAIDERLESELHKKVYIGIFLLFLVQGASLSIYRYLHLAPKGKD
jgi:hypothetical protein